ncbi:hypothetical protein ZWY2020_040866 [Hordeum vulgare]|nr:hypothetical protein ZWY2020_040866 [Hordeum vulgare]
MDPKVLLDFINVWYEDPNTPIDDLKLPPGVSHMVATFINEAKWKEQKAKQAKIAKARKEKFLRQNLLKLTPEALVSNQAELQVLTDKCDKLSDRKSIKRNFIKLATSDVDDYNQHQLLSPWLSSQKMHLLMRRKFLKVRNNTKSVVLMSRPLKKSSPRPPLMKLQPLMQSLDPNFTKGEEGNPSHRRREKTRAAEKEAKKRKASSAEEKIEAKRLKETEESAPLDPVPLNVAPSYEMVVIGDQTTRTDEEMKDAASEEHTDEEIQIDESPQPHIPQTETTQASAAAADESASATKSADENQAEENVQFEQAPPTEQADQTPQAKKEEEIPQPEAQPEQEIPADEIPQPEETAEENVPYDNDFIVLNPDCHGCFLPFKDNIKPVQRQPFSKRPKFQKENFFEERMYFIGENPYDKPQMRHLKFWTRTQMNYYASVLCGRNKVFQYRHIPHDELEEIPCMEPVLRVLHDAGLLPMCSDISDWNSELILQFYATLHISGNADDINTWVFDWMTQNTHYKAPASELLRELPVPIPSDGAVKLYGERELPNGMIVLVPIKGHDDEEDVVGLMKNILFNIIHGIPMNIHDFFLRTLADNAMCPYDHKIYAPWIMRFLRTRTSINFHADFQNHVGYMPPIQVNKKTFEPIEGKGKSVIDEGNRPLDG